MPIKIPNGLPAIKQLKAENIFVMTEKRASTQHVRPLRLLLLNLMPTKEVTETQILRKLSNTPLQVEVKLMRVASHEARNTPAEHLRSFYTTFAQVREEHFDGMIVTGAPVEQLPFDQVDYWDELCEIFEWAKTHVHSTFNICWGAQAALYYYYGIDKHPLGHKLTGVFEHRLTKPTSPLVRGFDTNFMAPHSRNTTVFVQDIERHPDLELVAVSDEAGAYLAKSVDSRLFFVFGHSEYDFDTLAKEYWRDRETMGDDAPLPQHYFPDDDSNREPQKTWNAHSQLLYSNWLNYYVYQTTPFDFSQVGVLHADLEEVTSDVGLFSVVAQGTDQVGVVAVLATALADLGVAIDDIGQDVDEGRFRIVINAHVATDDSTLDDIKQAMAQLANGSGITIDVVPRAGKGEGTSAGTGASSGASADAGTGAASGAGGTGGANDMP